MFVRPNHIIKNYLFQTSCLAKTSCTMFTFFPRVNTTSSCILYQTCHLPLLPCHGCVTGPPAPWVGHCLHGDTEGPILGEPTDSDLFAANIVENDLVDVFDDDFYGFAGNDIRIGANDKENRRRSKRNDLDDDEINIDDGLLDEVFEDLPENRRKPLPKPSRPTPTSTRNSNGAEGSFTCVMGGSNTNGPVSKVSVMDIGTYSVPTRKLISSFPPFMTRGSGNTFSLFSSTGLHTCTPGYQVQQLVTFSRFGFGQQGPVQSSYIPGSCNQYNFRNGQWSSAGGMMTQFRNGGSTVNVGSYVMSMGGFDPFGRPLSSVEIFDPRRPQVGWHEVPQWSSPRATKDQCTVVMKDRRRGSQIMVLGGVGQEYSARRLVLTTNSWLSVPPMNHPRTQHSCISLTLNGRPGVVVSGGRDTRGVNNPSVEFFDMNTNKWINLPSLSRGRRGHTMTTIRGQMAVAGGVATGRRGDDDTLDDVELFDGRQWKSARYRMDQPRTGANLVRIPFGTFFG